MRTLRVTDEEWQILIDALSSGPDPEHYDFGPAYALDSERWQRLLQRIKTSKKS